MNNELLWFFFKLKQLTEVELVKNIMYSCFNVYSMLYMPNNFDTESNKSCEIDETLTTIQFSAYNKTEQ